MKRTLIVLPTVLLFLSACGNLLAGDITPPPGAAVAQQTQEPEIISEALYPLVPPSVVDGKLIYEEKCEPCHGTRGLGDGPSASELPNPVTAIGSEEVARKASPSGWYRIVTEGNLERFMPPFDSLSDRERWDVVAYAFSLSTQQNDSVQAASLYSQYCADCHGEGGNGEGLLSADIQTAPASFKDMKVMVTKTSQDFYQTITEGVGSEMPAFSEQISEQERWLLSDYIRDLLFYQASDLASVGTPDKSNQMDIDASEQPASGDALLDDDASLLEIGSVVGDVINASSGEALTGAEVTLYGFDEIQQVYTATTRLDADGNFTFSNVEMPPDRVFMTTTEYGGITYGSNVGTAHADGMILELPIMVYETTTDQSQLIADRLHFFYELLDAETMRVVELYIISNRSDKTVVAEDEGSPVVEFILPDVAKNIEIEDGTIGDGRYVSTENGFGDTVSVRPGTGTYQIMYTYLVPYERNLTVSHTLPLAAEAIVVLAPENLRIKTDSLQNDGLRDVQGIQYQMFSSTNMPAGEKMEVTLSGSIGSSFFSSISGSTSSLLLGLAALVIVLVGGGIWLYRRNQEMNGKSAPDVDIVEDSSLEEDEDAIMDAIIALDDLYRDGKLPDEAYHQRRSELKARLKEIMGVESRSDD